MSVLLSYTTGDEQRYVSQLYCHGVGTSKDKKRALDCSGFTEKVMKQCVKDLYTDHDAQVVVRIKNGGALIEDPPRGHQVTLGDMMNNPRVKVI